MAQKIFPAADQLVLLGSIFPDTTVGNSLIYSQTHCQGDRLYQYVKKREPDFLPFVLGIITHGVQPAGLDYYGDEKYLHFEKGYCFEKARSIIESTIQACNLPQRFGWWKAHNFIEMAIELEIASWQPQVRVALSQAYDNTEIIAWAAEILADFYYVTPQEIIAGITYFRNYVLDEEVNSSKLAVNYDLQMIKKHSIKINVQQVEELILYAGSLVKDDYIAFLEYCSKQIRKTLDRICAK